MMKRFVLYPLLVFAAMSYGWHGFEYFWDGDLFPEKDLKMKVENVGTARAKQLIDENPDLQIVDVRPERSYRSNHLPGAVNVRYGGGEWDDEGAKSLDPAKPALVYCDGGFRSRMSLSAFEKAGFTEIYHLHRGILSWRFRGNETEAGELSDSAE
ncbi:MAG: rhodanese-like domain-containing protein [Verrucomicrobiales bacterium]|nr:rhodanese-like domain-containing protein [Verrucomicrobiales bacterium]